MTMTRSAGAVMMAMHLIASRVMMVAWRAIPMMAMAVEAIDE
jgi:hypothetical protein